MFQTTELTDCKATSFITRFPNAQAPPVQVYTNSRIVYADGKQQISFYVSAIGNDGTESSLLTKTIMSGLLSKSFVRNRRESQTVDD